MLARAQASAGSRSRTTPWSLLLLSRTAATLAAPPPRGEPANAALTPLEEPEPPAPSTAAEPHTTASRADGGYVKFLRKFESPQFSAVKQMMANPMTLTQLQRLAADPGALAAARKLRDEAARNPHMLALLQDQERRIRQDPQLAQTMGRMQAVLEQPHEPLPAAASDGLPTPSMSLGDLLGDEAKRQQLRALTERALADPQLREHAASMLQDPSVQQRLRSLQADMIEEPGVWARLLQTLGAQLPGRAPSQRPTPPPPHHAPP